MPKSLDFLDTRGADRAVYLLQDGLIEVFTYKQGLLASVAHDLKFELGKFRIELDADEVRGCFELDSLRVIGVMHGSRCDQHVLGPAQKQEIEANARRRVLGTETHPQALLKARWKRASATVRLHGELGLRGRKADVELAAQLAGERVRGEVEIEPSRWGISPFRALLGAIRLQDRVRIRFDLELPQPMRASFGI
jgi:hypothetical protein